jgi:hypothetical protein
MRVFCVAVGLAMLLSACGQAANQASSAKGPESVSSTPSTPPKDPEPPSNVAEPTPPQVPPGTPTLPADAVSPVPREQVEAPTLPDQKVIAVNGGRTLQFTAMARDACAGVQAIVADQNDRVVQIVVSPADTPQGGPPDQMCAQVLTPRMVTVDLKAPLGNRKIIITGG